MLCHDLLLGLLACLWASKKAGRHSYYVEILCQEMQEDERSELRLRKSIAVVNA